MANATIVSLKAALTAPLPNNPKLSVPGAVLVSDSFARNGNLIGSNSDSFMGGVSKVWAGTTQTATTNAASQNGVTGYVTVQPTAITSNSIDVGNSNFSAEFKIPSGPTNNTLGFNALIDFRKAAAETGDCNRLVLYKPAAYPAGQIAMRLAKRVSGAGSYMSDVDIPVVVGTDKVRVDLKGSLITVYVNDVAKLSVTDTSPLAGTFFGFAASSQGLTHTYSVGQLVIRSL